MKHRLHRFLLAAYSTGTALGLLLLGSVLSDMASAQLTPGTPTGNTVGRSELTWLDVTKPPYNAKGDAKRYDTAAMTSGDATLVVTGASFTSAIVDKHVRIQGGGISQTETFTGAGAISGTTNLTLSVSVTAAGMTGSPLTIPPVPVATGDATATWVAKVVYGLRNVAAFRTLYSVDYDSGTPTVFTVRRKAQAANDGTLIVTVSVGADTTNASLPISSANGTAGVVAPAELVTTVASYTNSTTLELDDVAPGTYTAATVFIGTDDTAAINAAYTAANAGLGGRTVYIPKGPGGGGYLCNAVGYSETYTFGDGGGMLQQFDTPTSASVNSRTLCPTVLFPALSSAPALSFGTCFGVKLERFMICGARLSGGRKGVGLQLGDPPPATGYEGGNVTMDKINVAGFEYAISGSRIVDTVAKACNFTDSRICIYGPENWDTSKFDSCIVGGTDAEWCAWFSGAKNITIDCGDWNLAEHSIYQINSDIHIANLNNERIQGTHYEVASGYLNIAHIKTLSATGPLIDVTGPTVQVSVGTANLNSIGPAAWNGLHVLYRSAGVEYPDKLPRGGVILRYSSNAFTTFQQAEWTETQYRLPGNFNRSNTFEDSFGGGTSTAIGNLGWITENIVGTGSSQRFADPGSSGIGVAESYSGNNLITNVQCFRLPNKTILASTAAFELHWTMYVEDEANARTRWGLYSVDSSRDIEPLYGIGFHCDRSTPDATVFAEVINNGSITRVDTGMAYTGLSAMKEYVIHKNAQGIFFTIRNNSVQTPVVVVPMLRHTVTTAPTGDYLTPSIYGGVSAVTYVQAYSDKFLLECIQP